jgi:hypothetical protein
VTGRRSARPARSRIDAGRSQTTNDRGAVRVGGHHGVIGGVIEAENEAIETYHDIVRFCEARTR